MMKIMRTDHDDKNISFGWFSGSENLKKLSKGRLYIPSSSPIEDLDPSSNCYVGKYIQWWKIISEVKVQNGFWEGLVREFYQWERNSAVCPSIQPSIRLAAGGGELPGGSGGCAMQEMLGLHCRTLIAAFYDGATEKCISNTSAGAALPAPRRCLELNPPSLLPESHSIRRRQG